jgi:hypothetical protein
MIVIARGIPNECEADDEEGDVISRMFSFIGEH